jgi:hypothetical protein
MFVVDRVQGGRAQWKKVLEPAVERSSNRLLFLINYLVAAKEQAKAVPDDVELGIHNPGDPPFDHINTANGSFLSISSDKIWSN